MMFPYIGRLRCNQPLYGYIPRLTRRITAPATSTARCRMSPEFPRRDRTSANIWTTNFIRRGDAPKVSPLGSYNAGRRNLGARCGNRTHDDRFADEGLATCRTARNFLVRKARVELARALAHQGLSLARLPFHHYRTETPHGTSVLHIVRVSNFVPA